MIETFNLLPYETNTYVIKKQGHVIIIDPSLNFDGIYEALKKEYQIEAFLLTHAHIDHIAGLMNYHEPIYLMKDEIEVLLDNSKNLSGKRNGFKLNDMNRLRPLSDNDSIPFLEDNFLVIETKGHTKGSCCFLYNNKYLFSGDTLFKESIGRTDFPTSSSKDMKKSLERLVKLNDHLIVLPGHGEKTTLKEEKKNNEFLKFISK